MDRLIYLSMAGAKATLQRQDSLANNLANASTPGFRAEMQAFRAVPVVGQGATTRAYVLESTIGHDQRPGPEQSTGRTLDVAAQGNAWFAVQSLDGTEAYTRGGAFQVSPEGQLVTPSGLPVLGDGGPITVGLNAQVDISSDGIITATTGSGKPQQVGKLKLVVPPAPLNRGTDGLFRAADGADLPAEPTARVRAGALEGSNVSPVETLVAMIAASRQFEQQMKMLQGAEQREQGAAKLLGPQS
jgi:flagellar basal-body rod protein FlgF